MDVPLENIEHYLETNQLNKLREEMTKLQPADIAELFEELSKDKSLKLFRLLPKTVSADVFSYLSSDKQQEIVENITDDEIKNIVNEMFIDDTVDFIEEMPANLVDKILQNTSPDIRNLINQFLRYPENSAGSVMTVEYVALKNDVNIGQALHSIKKFGIDNETIDICYIIDNQRKLVGYISLKKLIFLDDDVYISDAMEKTVISCHTTDDQELIANDFRHYDLTSMPVVDNEDRLVGIITVDDVVDVIEQENTEDIQKMAGMAPSDEEYLKDDVFSLIRQRITWLLVLMIIATISGIIIRTYGKALQSGVVLMSFIPMLMSTGGCAGLQSSTLITRGLTLDEIEFSDIWLIIWKEVRVSLIISTILSVINFLMIHYLSDIDFNVALAISITLFITIVMSKVIGSILPIAAKLAKLDPAIIASPLITTVIDVCTLILFFTISIHYLHL